MLAVRKIIPRIRKKNYHLCLNQGGNFRPDLVLILEQTSLGTYAYDIAYPTLTYFLPFQPTLPWALSLTSTLAWLEPVSTTFQDNCNLMLTYIFCLMSPWTPSAGKDVNIRLRHCRHSDPPCILRFSRLQKFQTSELFQDSFSDGPYGWVTTLVSLDQNWTSISTLTRQVRSELLSY